jgi:hypothetical protein
MLLKDVAPAAPPWWLPSPPYHAVALGDFCKLNVEALYGTAASHGEDREVPEI